MRICSGANTYATVCCGIEQEFERTPVKPVRCPDGKMRDYRAHGLRKAACTQLAEAGATAPEIMAVSGHVTLAEAQKYVSAVEQRKMAKAAMAKRAAGSNPVREVTDAQSVETKKC